MKILSGRPWLLIVFFLISNFFSSVAVSIGMYLIPWCISNTAGEPAFLATTAMFSALLILFLTPFIGKLIDSLNRKSILIFITIVILVLFLFLSLAKDNVLNRLYALICAYVFVQIYFAIFYTTRQGFIKDIFMESELFRINAILEIESQSSTLLAASLVIIFANSLTNTDIFMLLAGMVLISLMMLMVIPYASKRITDRNNRQYSHPKLPPSFLKTDLFCYMAMGAIPFICIMTINVIQAPFMNDVLLEPISAYATYGIIYGCGAILVGFILGRISNHYSQCNLVVVFTSVFAITLGVISLHPTLEFILVGGFFLGFCNSASRISSHNLILHEVDSAMIGRAFSYEQFFTLCGRIIATGLVPLMFANNYRQVWNYVFAISMIAPIVLLFRRYLDKNTVVTNKEYG
ncbi:MFS transporter [Xenorhabdus sp. PR6a]|uniref:MFS transporter n=1 Tax=Xenorhabdus sp. PR6a TaxID=3025877 RepID=UPI002358D3FB|nr:MFS transporter [Xenorhabdus sp. PR6a]MDC9582937.1 MFS transporter [Xenorhabdus sp. PR6a]